MCLIVLLSAFVYAQENACRFEVTPTTIHFFDVWGGRAEIRVTASSPDCRFSVETKYPWISFSATQDGTEGKVVVTAEGNNSLTHRVGSVFVDGWEVSVIQAGPRRGGDSS